ncbi:hypothetical protein GCM10027275_45140 [Rhabdobacter roseus]|uniref:Lipocalin-like domain-containing protein n=1 Tax=Rhabdobacter roseus TaxID=1655419 RepID=A0A840TZ45_9BACT|nr:lipocalin family protein [Rhabdobacter roseus]MBB5286817.1 hypothetical protein [Rhabdobacter roseus]
MRRIATLLLIFSMAACRSKEAVDPANALVGTWRLTTYCKPSGQSTCNEVKVPANKHVYISFSNDLTFNESYENTIPVEYGFLGCGRGSYAMEDNQLRIRAMCMSSTYGNTYPIVSLTSQQLVLNPWGSGEYVFKKHSPRPR